MFWMSWSVEKKHLRVSVYLSGRSLRKDNNFQRSLLIETKFGVCAYYKKHYFSINK